jgi:EAL domain-containing protein (putative c-di-GMP-specific phosphodiesterase class I)
VRSSVDLARNLGLDVVAEGVETEQTWQQLADLGCDQAQGFFFARPMPAADIPAWLATWGARESVNTR